LKPNRRKRGGQKGNLNARKHGFYSPTLSPAETDQLWAIANIEGVDPRIALLRVKLQSSLQHDPGNRRVLTDASRLLAKAYSDMYSLDAADSNYLKTFIERILESIVIRQTLSLPAQEYKRPVLTKRIMCTLTTSSACPASPLPRMRATELLEEHNHHTSQNESSVLQQLNELPVTTPHTKSRSLGHPKNTHHPKRIAVP
jgi:hypothetical protein